MQETMPGGTQPLQPPEKIDEHSAITASHDIDRENRFARPVDEGTHVIQPEDEETQVVRPERAASPLIDPGDEETQIIKPGLGVLPVTPQLKPVWPPPSRKRRRTGLPIIVTVLIILLSLLLIAGGMGFIVYSTSRQYQTSLHHIATAAVQATKNTIGTAQSETQGTARSLASAQANIDATATAQADEVAQATTTVDNATATASSLNDLYTSSTSNAPDFDDPLSDNTGAGGWDQGNPSTGTGCSFVNSLYDVSEAQQGYLQPCLAQNTRYTNFTYQAHITIAKGNPGGAGILFRVDSTDTSYYFFYIGSDGSYALDLYQSNKQSTLARGVSSAITTGLNQSNQIAVIANSNLLYLYANGQYLAGVADSTLSAGKIGVGVVNRGTPIDAQYNDTQLWISGAQATPTQDTSASQGSPMPQDTTTPDASPTT